MSARVKSYTVIMVSAINAGIEQGIIDLDDTSEFGEVVYEFDLPNGIPCKARIWGDQWGEVHFNWIWVNPDMHADVREVNVIRTSPFAKRKRNPVPACDAIVHGWLERARGKWIQRAAGGVSRTCLVITNEMKNTLSKISVKPNGFKTNGPIIL